MTISKASKTKRTSLRRTRRMAVMPATITLTDELVQHHFALLPRLLDVRPRPLDGGARVVQRAVPVGEVLLAALRRVCRRRRVASPVERDDARRDVGPEALVALVILQAAGQGSSAIRSARRPAHNWKERRGRAPRRSRNASGLNERRSYHAGASSLDSSRRHKNNLERTDTSEEDSHSVAWPDAPKISGPTPGKAGLTLCTSAMIAS